MIRLEFLIFFCCLGLWALSCWVSDNDEENDDDY
jgi:hypothetical protein